MTTAREIAQRKCVYCGKPIKDDEVMITEDGDTYHIGCAAEEADGNALNNDMGD